MTFRAKLSLDISGISDEYVSWNYQTIDSAVVKVFKLKRQFKVLYLIRKFISWCNVTSHKHLDLFELLLGLRKKSLVIAWAIVSGCAWGAIAPPIFLDLVICMRKKVAFRTLKSLAPPIFYSFQCPGLYIYDYYSISYCVGSRSTLKVDIGTYKTW